MTKQQEDLIGGRFYTKQTNYYFELLNNYAVFNKHKFDFFILIIYII